LGHDGGRMQATRPAFPRLGARPRLPRGGAPTHRGRARAARPFSLDTPCPGSGVAPVNQSRPGIVASAVGPTRARSGKVPRADLKRVGCRIRGWGPVLAPDRPETVVDSEVGDDGAPPSCTRSTVDRSLRPAHPGGANVADERRGKLSALGARARDLVMT